MALIGSIALSMVANTSGLTKGLAKGASAVESWGSAATKRLAAGAAVGGAAMAALGIKAGASAAHLDEAFNKTTQVFGAHGDSVIATANKMADAYGTERQAYLDGTAALGGQLQGVGYAENDAAALSTQLGNLAADAAAFRDVGFEESLGKIRAGLSGEAEPLKAWGITIDDAATKTEGLRLGLVKQGQEMDNAAKVQARLSLIQKGLAKDSGALARESTGTAAQMSEFWGRLSHLMETIGTTTAPILGGALQGVNQAIVAAGLAWEDGSAAVMSWFGVTSEGVEGATGGVGIFGKAVEWLGTAWDMARGGVATFFSYFEAGISKVSGWMASILDGLHKLGAGDWAASARDALQGYSDAARSTSEGMAGYAAEAFADKAGQASDSYWAQARAKIDAARQEMATSKQDEIGAPKTAEAAVKPAKSTSRSSEFSEAMKLGSASAASTLLRSRYGLGKDGAAESAKQTAANTKEVVPALKAIETAIKAKVASPAVFTI